jgi:hypothetical protein
MQGKAGALANDALGLSPATTDALRSIDMNHLSFLRALLSLSLSFIGLTVFSRAEIISVGVGQPATLSVSADGTPPFTYQWYKDGVPLEGATGATHVISDSQLISAGVYAAEVSNDAGSTMSDSATLAVQLQLQIVNTAPAIVTQPASRTVTEGAAVTFSVVATGTPAPTYQWRKNGVNITGATAASYTVSSASAASAATYSVVVTNSGGSVTSSGAVLTVNTLPDITTQPVDRTAAVGSSVSFSVVATGTPSPTYQWLKNGTTITGATGRTYTIASVTTSHADYYSVRVTNSVGSVRSQSAALTVSTGPVITTQPVGRTVVAGSTVTLTVAATGEPAPTYQWRKDGTAITGATGSSYVLTGVTTAQAGTYSVVAKNSYGSVTSANAVLKVNPPLPKQADFNRDGKSDLLWQNVLTGEHSVWLMSGTTRQSAVDLSQTSTDWEVIGISDFNGDGRNDILLQNLVTRDSRVWLMDGTTLDSGVSLGVAPTGMLMAGTGDFNADGMPDILWHNTSTGAYSIRFMNRLTPGTSYVIGTGPTGWTIGGTGDFNGDRKPDILWQRVSDGAARVWLMNGKTYASATDLGAMGSGWILGGTGDFNGDGKTDILWQNTDTGARKVALMSGLTKTGEVSLGGGGPEWIIAN